MKILIVGGTGMIGANLALLLESQGDDVTLAARHAPASGSPMAHFPVLSRDYTKGEFTAADLAPFDAIVFGAGNDIRHIGAGADRAAFWQATQIDGVPNFIRLARDAGVPRVIQLGSYYHQVMPSLAENDDYIRARQLADERGVALAAPGFNVSTLNPPSIVGMPPGQLADRYIKLIAYARGQLDLEIYAPTGGTNFMSVRSLSEAVVGALSGAESGRSYLIGDENLSFRDYVQLFFDAVGNPTQVEARDQNHPLVGIANIVPNRGTIAYEPDPAETAMLGYRRHDVRRAVEDIAAAYR